MPSKPPDAFLSYTRFDDQHDSGAISQFRQRLESAVRAVTGEPFEIFQDVDGIGLGGRWPDKLDKMLGEARFFIPILTPSYFRSKACRDELEKFLRAEERAGRDDLVLPIYYIRTPMLDEEELRKADALATIVHERQRWDWRDRRHYSFATRKIRLEIEALATAIDQARQRAMPARATFRPIATTPKSTAVRWQPTISTKRPFKSAASSLVPGFRDIDGPWCPEMVVIPPGEFMMGSTETERQWAVGQGAKQEWVEREKPQQQVRILHTPAVGRFPVTLEEYGHFARTTERPEPRDQGWGRGRRPVINVDWQEAKSFAAWLSVQAGQPYRLLSEAEWEYACRAGTMTGYSWGDGISPENANYYGSVGRTTEVGSYPANPWGLCDMHGNVWEWVEDCLNDSYEGAPNDGTAWTSGDCSRRVLRGGSWDRNPGCLRSAYRGGGDASYRSSNIGFRVARTLTGPPVTDSPKETDWSELKYHDPALSGRITFNYSNNNGQYSIGRDEFFFETRWSKASDRSIHLYNEPPSIIGVAEAPEIHSYKDIRDPARYDMSSRVRTIQRAEHALLKNIHNNYAVLKILAIKDSTRSDSVDELTFDFWILTNVT